MGTLTYDGQVKVDFDDRLLAHLQIVIGAKLRRGEAFHFTWRDDPSVGGGRTTVWVNPGIPLVYKFRHTTRNAINPAWVEKLTEAANSPTGLYVMHEPEATSE